MFKIAKMRTLAERAMEIYEPTANEAIALGEALVLTAGKLTKAGATVVPEYIAMSAGTNEPIAVVRVLEEDCFETEFAADAKAVAEGAKVTLHTDGLKVTATTTSGVFYITKKIGTGAIGTKVQGMFRR